MAHTDQRQGQQRRLSTVVRRCILGLVLIACFISSAAQGVIFYGDISQAVPGNHLHPLEVLCVLVAYLSLLLMSGLRYLGGDSLRTDRIILVVGAMLMAVIVGSGGALLSPLVLVLPWQSFTTVMHALLPLVAVFFYTMNPDTAPSQKPARRGTTSK